MAQASQSVETLIGQISSTKFQIRRLLGAGGMGAVFEAEHLFTKRVGALKLLHEHFSQVPEIVERFTREASAAGRIANPHIVETYDAGRLESGHPYMFMELLSGKALDEVLAERESLPFEQAIGIAAQAAAGLAAAHKSGIIHRDIKPANLFLVDGPGLLVKLLDFGISKFALPDEVSRVTQEGAALGTPYYMPPEQVMGRVDIDERVDIYALGVVLYEMVVGRPPYIADTLPALSVRIYEGRYAPVSTLRPDTPPGFEAVVAACLAVDRERRYASMHDLLADLQRLMGRHAESLAPTLIAGSPLQIDSLPPPAGSGAYLPGPSAAPGPIRSPAATAAGMAVTATEATTHPPRPRWLPWVAILGAVAAVSLVIGVTWPQQPEPTAAPVLQPSSAVVDEAAGREPITTSVAAPNVAPAASSSTATGAAPTELPAASSASAPASSSAARRPSAAPRSSDPEAPGPNTDGLKRDNPFE
jgi:eukaryotic-like serine/threonine-protein kinase